MELLIKAGKAAMRHMERILVEHALTFPQFELLTVVAAGQDRPIGELADEIGCSRGNLTGVTDRLENAGLIERTRNPDDRRSVTVALTEQGRKVYTAARQAVAPYLNQPVDDGVAGYLAHVILKMHEAAEAAAGQ